MAPENDPAQGSTRPPHVRVVTSMEMATELALEELRQVIEAGNQPLISFATGSTFTLLLRRLAAELQSRRISVQDFVATHLDEYLGFLPDTPGGMVHELIGNCPPLGEMLRRGTFLPVPSVDDPEVIEAHARRLQRAGGVALQLVGIGRNGHLAFHEPGTPFVQGFHVATLSESTRDDARARFLNRAVPERAVTSGLADILAARRVVLMAFGHHKAKAVRAMLEGDVSPACPASALRRHRDVRVFLDREAAAELAAAAVRESSADQETP